MSVTESSESGGLTFDTYYVKEIPGTNSYTYHERMRISGNGNVGIGADSPLAKLHVKDNGKDVLQAYNDAASGAGVLRTWSKRQ